ncbi:MAG: AAA family ATPase [Promethearchaeota archaeon]
MTSLQEKNRYSLTELVTKLAKLDNHLQKFISEHYFNSQSIINLDFINHDQIIPISIKLPDILLIGAITQSPVMLSGSSGSGKTLLAELMASFLFGETGYARKNITPDMNEQDFMDIDFGAIKEGKKLKEAMIADKLFESPCIIIDEANRAPPIIQNRLLQILENNIDLKSKIIHAGKKLSNGEYYHWKILTLNLGTEYAGTSAVDRALKDRVVLDLPIDNFPPTLEDQILMIRGSAVNKNYLEGLTEKELIYELYQNLDLLDLSLEAEALILYFSFLSNCVKSPTGSKYGVIFSPHYCKKEDCSHSRNPPLNDFCPFVFAPSNRVLRRLVSVAKGFTLLKQAKIINHLKKTKNNDEIREFLTNLNFDVSLEDVASIAPIVLNSKISMNMEWVLEKFNGNTFLACKHLVKKVNSQLKLFMRDLLKPLVDEMRGKSLSEKNRGIRNKAVQDDFHLQGLIDYVKKYLIV